MNAKIKKKTEDSRYISQNELDKTGFQHDITYGDFKDLTAILDKIFGRK